MKRTRPLRIRMNTKLFLVGLAVILGPWVGIELGGVKISVVEQGWLKALFAVVGILLILLSLNSTEPEAASAPQPTHRTSGPLPPLLRGTSFVGRVPALPARFVARKEVLDAVRADVLAHATVALVGMGGAGKTVMATAIAHDERVQKAFSDGIAWVDSGQQTPATELLEKLVARLSGENAVFSSIEEGRHRLAELLGGRAFMLIVDDIWDIEVLRALNVIGPPRGALLFTTRDQAMARAVDAETHPVDELDLGQALALLGRWTSTDPERLPSVADRLCACVGNLALGVALVGGMISARGSKPQAWDDVKTLLDNAEVERIADEYGPDNYQHSSALTSITVSIEDLLVADQDRYRELAVFAGRGSFPVTAAAAVWAAAGLSLLDTQQLLTRLCGRSLVQRSERGWFRLHELQYLVTRHQLNRQPDGLAHAHGHIIDGYLSPSGSPLDDHAGGAADPSVWMGGPNDGYFFENLAFHLAAGRGEQLNSLLAHYGWLERKLAVVGIAGLLADYTYQESLSPSVETIRDALQLSAYVLTEHPDLLAGQLIGRLLRSTEPAIQALLDTAQPSDGQPWMCPKTCGSLTEPGGPLERIVHLHTGTGKQLALTSDGQRIISASHDGKLQVWNLASGHLERNLLGHNGSVLALAVMPAGYRVVSGGADRTVRVWNWASGRPERIWDDHDGWVQAVAVTPDGKRIISASTDNTVRVWNLDTGCLEHTLKKHCDDIQALAVTPDGKRIVTGSRDHKVRVWNLTSPNEPEQVLSGHDSWVLSVAVTPDGKRIVTGSRDNTVRVWDLTSPSQPEQVLAGHDSWVLSVAVTPDGKRIISGGADKMVRVWDLASPYQKEHALEGHVSWVQAVAVARDGNHIVSGGDGTARIWSLASSFRRPTRQCHTDVVEAVTISPDGEWIISASRDHTVRVWNRASGDQVRILEDHTDVVEAVAISPDGEWIISGSRDHTVRVWNRASGDQVRILDDHTDVVEAVAISPDGEWIISASRDRTVRVWNRASGKAKDPFNEHPHRMTSVAVTPGGRHVISGSADGQVRIWNRDSGQVEHILEGHASAVSAVTVTPDGRRVVLGNEDGKMQVWNLASPRHPEHIVEAHTDIVQALAITADGQRVVSCGDRSVRAWNLSNGTEDAYWITDGTPVSSCDASQVDPAIVYGDSLGRIFVLTLREHSQ